MVNNFSLHVRFGKLFLLKCSQALSNWMEKSSLSFLCKPLCLLDLRICFCLKRANPWLKFRSKFNWHSMKSFQRALVGFNNLWIHFTFMDFNWVFMSKIPFPPLQMESWVRCLESCFFFLSTGNRVYFKNFFMIYFIIV